MYRKEIITELKQTSSSNNITNLEKEACQELIDKIKTHYHKENLCYCCNTQQESKDKIHKFKIKGRRYGSIFEDDNIEIHLCDKCKKRIKEEWFTEQPKIIDKYCEDYRYEDQIKEFINNLPVENQQYIYNSDKYNDINNIINNPKFDDYANNDDYGAELADVRNEDFFNAYKRAFL